MSLDSAILTGSSSLPRVGCPRCPDHLDTINIPRIAMATAPILIAASELVMMPRMHVDCSPPVRGPTLMVPCPPTLGRDSHLEYPSVPRVSTQQRTSESWLFIQSSAKKPKPTIAAINSPATVAGATVASRRPATVRLLTAANQITNVAGRKTKKSDEKVEKLATNDKQTYAQKQSTAYTRFSHPRGNERQRIRREEE